MRKKLIIASAIAIALVLSGCSSSSKDSAATSDEPVTITLWHNLGDTQNAEATKALTDAYTALHPNVTFDLVSQPGDNYFALLQAAAVSKSGPDLALMWTGLFALKYKSYLTNLKGLVSDAALAREGSLEWTADNFDAASGPYVMPLDRQFYIGFYNKDAFAKAGVSAVPTTWNELYAACGKLKSAGFTPIVYGNGGQSLGALYYPWYDASYIAIGQSSVSGLRDLYSGANQWNSAANIDSYSKYAALKTKGCTNSDVLTKTNNVEDFLGGKAAMIIDGTWDTKKFTDAFGDKVAAFVPPFSDSPIKGVVEFAGQGFGLTSYSKNQAAAAAFLEFMTTDEAAKVIDGAGLIPNINGATTSNAVNQQMLDFAATGGLDRYPMLDNVLQGDVVDAGNKIIPSILGGKTAVKSGLDQ
ncbi:MAG: extracellular solute-binding protein, partial [Actinobacteria bacterium]|nr:extracellular solute-binding protein [Actinomycetota bacterium]MSW23629.1 extracellular solute-binding protein [Actinomycetota bacterium]MSW75885.1 extracellular solute-binding protein [Actinomycetota bacterium]MSY30965.1 extracellular solute-binding protein [Actinomycetota bacterium]